MHNNHDMYIYIYSIYIYTYSIYIYIHSIIYIYIHATIFVANYSWRCPLFLTLIASCGRRHVCSTCGIEWSPHATGTPFGSTMAWKYTTGWWFQTWRYYVPFHIYGMSSQTHWLSLHHFSRWLLHHQPDNLHLVMEKIPSVLLPHWWSQDGHPKNWPNLVLAPVRCQIYCLVGEFCIWNDSPSSLVSSPFWWK